MMAYYQQGLGLDFVGTLEKIAPAVQAVSKVVEDPALPTVTAHVLRLNAITRGTKPGEPPPPLNLTPAQKQKGVGLYVIEPPLRGFVWARQNPIVAVAALAGIVGAIWYIGYQMGRP